MIDRTKLPTTSDILKAYEIFEVTRVPLPLEQTKEAFEKYIQENEGIVIRASEVKRMVENIKKRQEEIEREKKIEIFKQQDCEMGVF